MVKMERRLRRKMLEDPGPRSPATPPPPRGTPYGVRGVNAESRLAITEAPRDRQDQISRATAALVGAGEEPGARASSGENLQQQGPPGTGTSSGESFQQRKILKTDEYQRPRDGASKVNIPEFRYESALDIRAYTKTIVGLTFSSVHEQMYDAKRLEMLVEEMTEYTLGKFVDPSREPLARKIGALTTLLTNYPELNDNQLKEGLLERILEGARRDQYVQPLVASKAITAAFSKKKDVTAVVSKGLDIVKFL